MNNQVVIITGGSSGIGYALAEVFGRNGARVVITGRNATDLQAATERLTRQGITVMGLAGDVSRAADIEQMVKDTVAAWGTIHILINNAGISMRALFQDVELTVIQKVMDINFFGAVYATKACLPHILKNKGTIVGISSIAGYRGLPGRTGYSASKFALNGFLEALRTELLPTGVHVLTAAPGFTASDIRKRALTREGEPQGDSPRAEENMMTAEECAAHIYRAVVNRRRTLVLTRQGKLAVWLNKWWPSLADRLTYRVMEREGKI